MEEASRFLCGYTIATLRQHRLERKTTQRDLTVAETQLAEFQARLGKSFEHEAYMQELVPLRDQLRQGISEPAKEGTLKVTELCDRIEAMKSSRVIVATPERAASKISAEEPVTAEIKRQMEAIAEDATVQTETTWQQKLTEAAEANGCRVMGG